MARRLVSVRSSAIGALVLALAPLWPAAGTAAGADVAGAAPACAAALPLIWIDDAGAGRTALAAAQEEASRIWAAAGLALDWTHAEPRQPLGGDAVLVVVRTRIAGRTSDAGLRGRRRHTLGRVVRVDAERAGRLIELALPDVAAAVTSGPIAGRDLRDLPGVVRDRAVGCGLGRVVAHEIGHWLFGSAHTRHGLMRATIRRADLVGPIAPALPPEWPAALPAQLRSRRPCAAATPVRQPALTKGTATCL
jgi:hypothetical protein